MGIKWMIRKSDYAEIRKSLNKEADSKKLEALKKEVIAILEKKDSKELKKAIEYFEQDELRYSHLEKSVSGEWIEKAGYGVGTVRIWKGKKYKKVSASPVRWVRVFDKNDRGAATSMGKYIAQVKKCNSVEELYQFCMKQRSLFQDENGVDLPIMDKLKAAIDEQKGKVGDELDGSKHFHNKFETEKIKGLFGRKYTYAEAIEDIEGSIRYLTELRNNLGKPVRGRIGKNSEAEIEHLLNNLKPEDRSRLDKMYKEYKEFNKTGKKESENKTKDPETKSNQAENKRDKRIGGVALWDGKLKDAIKTGDADKIKAAMADIEKEYNSVKEKLTGDELDFAETEYKFRKRDAENALKGSKVLSNGKTVDEVREKYGIKVGKKEIDSAARDRAINKIAMAEQDIDIDALAESTNKNLESLKNDYKNMKAKVDQGLKSPAVLNQIQTKIDENEAMRSVLDEIKKIDGYKNKSNSAIANELKNGKNESSNGEKKKSFKKEMNELYDAQNAAWEGFESGSEIKSTPENSKKFYERVKKFVDDNNIKLSKKHYDEIEDNNGHSFNEALALAGAYGADMKEKALKGNKEASEKYKGIRLDLSKIDEFKTEKSESEKHQNRSDAMKGNQNAKKDFTEQENKEIIRQIKRAAEQSDGTVEGTFHRLWLNVVEFGAFSDDLHEKFSSRFNSKDNGKSRKENENDLKELITSIISNNNSSESMKGNKNAYKGFLSDEKVHHVKKMDYEVYEDWNTEKNIFAAHHKDGKFKGVSMSKDIAEMIDNMKPGFDGEEEVAKQIHKKYPKVQESYARQMLGYIVMGVGKARNPASVYIHDNRNNVSPEKQAKNIKDIKDMSDDELNSLERDYKDKVEKQKKENEKLYDEFNYSGQGIDHPSWKKWIDGSQKIKELDAEYWKVYDEIKKRENKANPSGMADPKKVNGYGEATDREITSATYKRDVARKEKDLNNFFGRGMNKKGVKKALFDLNSMLDDSEDDELEPDFEDESYSDYDASQPDLFNSPAYKVSAALDSIFGC